MNEVFCKECADCGVAHCAYPEECKTPEELAAWDRRQRAKATPDEALFRSVDNPWAEDP
jgi:hypothetical protein